VIIVAKAISKKIGKTVTWTNTTDADVAVSDIVVIGARIGIATVDIANDATGELSVEGVYEFPADNTVAISIGDTVYWDVADGKINKTATDNTLAGTAHSEKAQTETTVWVKID
jgi:predicted RecA/RadA family phage recombinase